MPALFDSNKVQEELFHQTESLIKTALMVFSIPIFIAIWWLLALYLQGQNFYYLPTPQEVLHALIQSITMDPATRLPVAANI